MEHQLNTENKESLTVDLRVKEKPNLSQILTEQTHKNRRDRNGEGR